MLYDEARIQALENEVDDLRQENARLLGELSRINRTPNQSVTSRINLQNEHDTILIILM